MYKRQEQVMDHIAEIGENRDSFQFDIDGAVVKVNSLSDRERLGSTANFPAGPLPISTRLKSSPPK